LTQNPHVPHVKYHQPGSKLVHPEKRKEERSSFTRQPRGKLEVLAGDRSMRVFEVVDMSPMGIRLRVDVRTSVGENIQIRYQADGVDLKLNGTVIWNSDSAPAAGSDASRDGCIIGIQLTGPSLLQAFW
jgi:hypothetical protein